MKEMLLTFVVALLSSCCMGRLQQISNPITEIEYQILGKNCNYVFEKCKNRKNDYEIVQILDHTDCFTGLSSEEVISILGNPTRFFPESELNPFLIYDLGQNENYTHLYQAKFILRNDTIIGGSVSKVIVYRN